MLRESRRSRASRDVAFFVGRARPGRHRRKIKMHACFTLSCARACTHECVEKRHYPKQLVLDEELHFVCCGLPFDVWSRSQRHDNCSQSQVISSCLLLYHPCYSTQHRQPSQPFITMWHGDTACRLATLRFRWRHCVSVAHLVICYVAFPRARHQQQRQGFLNCWSGFCSVR